MIALIGGCRHRTDRASRQMRLNIETSVVVYCSHWHCRICLPFGGFPDEERESNTSICTPEQRRRWFGKG